MPWSRSTSWVPRVEKSLKPIWLSSRATGTMRGLSGSLTLTSALPEVGSRMPAASAALAYAGPNEVVDAHHLARAPHLRTRATASVPGSG